MSIGELLVSSRSLAEYRAMFGLTDADLQRRLLDCPGGAASAVAEINAAGGGATACDPIYAHYDAVALGTLAQRETARGNRYVQENRDAYVWRHFADPAAHLASRTRAAERFAADRQHNPDSYVAGELPNLPFAAGEFDLVLSSHLLFSYADRLDLAFHHRAIRELVRVSRREVRIFPLIGSDPTRNVDLDELRRRLAADGIGTEIRRVDYEFQRGANETLVCV